jgi:hypothetical protein
MEGKLYRISSRWAAEVRNLWELFIPQVGIAINEDGDCRRCKMERIALLSNDPINVDVPNDFVLTVEKFMRCKDDLAQAVDEEFKELIDEHGT